MTVGVLCAVRGPVEADIVRAVGAAGSGLEVTRRCADLAELLACAAAGLARIAVVSADLPRLDGEAVRHLHGSGVRVVLIGAPGARAAGADLGADAVLDPTGADAAVVPVVTELLERGHPAPAPTVADRLVGTLGSPGAAPVEPTDGLVLPPRDAHGRVVAVWGPTGAPGRTTVAVNLATEMARHVAGDGDDVLLVDADTYGGTVAATLGMLDEAPGVAAAVRAAAAGRLDAVGLAGLARRLDSGVRVLTGLTRADRWPELTPSGLEALWDAARSLAAWTVVDCGFCLEQDEVLSYDTRAPRRNGSTLSALEAADVVVVVGTGDPIGLQRLVRALAELDDCAVPMAARRVVVVNRVRASASGPRPGEAILQALGRYAGVRDAVLVPHDATCDAALLSARTLAEQAEGAPARRAIAELAQHVVAMDAVRAAH